MVKRVKAKTLEDMQRVSRWMCFKAALAFVALALLSDKVRDDFVNKCALPLFMQKGNENYFRDLRERANENPAGQPEIQPPQGL